MTWIAAHDMVDAPEYLLYILHNECGEIRFIYQRQTYIHNIGRGIVLLKFRRDCGIIPLVNNSFRFAKRSARCAGDCPHEVAIRAGTAVPPSKAPDPGYCERRAMVLRDSSCCRRAHYHLRPPQLYRHSLHYHLCLP